MTQTHRTDVFGIRRQLPILLPNSKRTNPEFARGDCGGPSSSSSSRLS